MNRGWVAGVSRWKVQIATAPSGEARSSALTGRRLALAEAVTGRRRTRWNTKASPATATMNKSSGKTVQRYAPPGVDTVGLVVQIDTA